MLLEIQKHISQVVLGVRLLVSGSGIAGRYQEVRRSRRFRSVSRTCWKHGRSARVAEALHHRVPHESYQHGDDLD